MRGAVVCGAGGFIGGHLAADLLRQGFAVRAIDVKPKNEWHQVHPDAENIVADLSLKDAAFAAVNGADVIYNLACNVGGMGYLATHKTQCMLNVLINTHLLQAAAHHGVKRFFFASSACVYNSSLAKVNFSEDDAYPSLPDDGYGWEKLFSERMCRHFREDFGVPTRIARFHNIYGPFADWHGGRERAPAAICRKVIEAKLSAHQEIEIWGDGNQIRSFTYITDCIKGIHQITDSKTWHDPINLGSSEGVTINQLVDIAEEIAGIKLIRRYNLNAPRGVPARNSDNTLIKKIFDWEPNTPLRVGLEKTYDWINQQYKKKPATKSKALLA